jgi:hemoglobin
MQQTRDIENREDIAFLIRSFYTHAMQDELIGTFFTEVAELNLEEHLPIMEDFWENLLFHTGAYHGGMMYKHIQLNSKKNIEADHFGRWLFLFAAEVDKHFAGPVAEEAKQRARAIAPTMNMRFNHTLLPMTWS